jgi:hypothetical protein
MNQMGIDLLLPPPGAQGAMASHRPVVALHIHERATGSELVFKALVKRKSGRGDALPGLPGACRSSIRRPLMAEEDFNQGGLLRIRAQAVTR